MDRDLLSRLVAEAGRLATGSVISGVLCRPGHGLALLLETPSCRALEIAPGPPRPRFALTGMRLRMSDGPHASLVGRLRKGIVGGVVVSVDLLASDRIARVTIDGRGTLILEVLGGATNLVWLDPEDRVEAVFRKTGRPGGSLVAGQPWRLPTTVDQRSPPPVRWETPDTSPCEAPGLLLTAAAASAHPLRPLPPGSATVISDGPGDTAGVFHRAELLGDALLRREFLLETRELAYGRLTRLRSGVRRARTKLSRLLTGLRVEKAGAADPGQVRRRAEAILAGLSVARREGGELVVPDPYSTRGDVLRLALDPAIPDRVHADRLFQRAARMQRIDAEVTAKIAGAERREAVLVDLETAVESARDTADLAAIEQRAAGLLPERQPPAPPTAHRKRRADRTSDPRDRRVKRYVLDKDWRVLVGGSGADNDYVTFRLAAARDFWLHVADYPGAHVIVRNPRRLTDLPDTILRQAAGIAVHFSKAPGGGRVDVRWTQVRHVRKPRGCPAGMVLLPRFSTVSAEPLAPPRRGPLA